MKSVKLWVAISALIGPAISYSSIYLFHAVVLLWFAFVFFSVIQQKKITINNIELIVPFLLLLVYSWFTVLWHPDTLMWARYQFYYICGLIAIMSIYQYVTNMTDLNKVFFFLGVVMIGNIIVGFLETLELIRLPTSKYSPYNHLLGYERVELHDIDDVKSEDVNSRPTGFSFNTNTFGFLVLLSYPFFIFNKSVLIKFFGTVFVIWILFFIGSKTLFASFVFMVAIFAFFSRINLKSIFSFYILLLIVSPSIFSLPYFLVDIPDTINRMYSVIDEALLMVTLIEEGSTVASGSTFTRAYFYYTGLNEFLNSYGLGVGLGGIQSITGSAFHFFFFQLLIDLGFAVFLLVMYFYFKLVIKLRMIFFRSKNHDLSYYARASSVSLIVAIPASLAPSSLIYQLGFYLLIGFALVVLKVYKKEVV